MGLSFGWKAAEVRESYWIDDPDLVNVSAAARQAWEQDGDASHLRPFATKGTTLIRFRTLNQDEIREVQRVLYLAGGDEGATLRAAHTCFRLGVEIPSLPPKMKDPGGGEHSAYVVEAGLSMLAQGACDGLEAAFPGIINFYGLKILIASIPSQPEKKASSPPSTETPFSNGTESPAKDAEAAPSS